MNEDVEYYDLSPEVSEDLSVWPGDVGFIRTPTMEFKEGGNLLLSSIRTTLHVGAHADAPNHYHPDGQGIEARNLNFYFGGCQVITVSLPSGNRILPSHLGKTKILEQRVLFKTSSFPNPNQWNPNFSSLSPDLINFLSDQGVILVGIDTPSIDLSDDKLLISHRAVYQRNMAVLEGIVLTQVRDGTYTLVALPLRIRGADASPVRAILIKNRKVIE